MFYTSKTRLRITLLLIACLFFSAIYGQDAAHTIIPKPSYVQSAKGSFLISSKTKIYYSKGALPVASFISAFLRQPTGYAFPLSLTGKTNSKGIHLIIDPSFDDNTRGAYHLEIGEDKVVAKAKDNAGSFYAIQSIRQLLPPGIESRSVVKNQTWSLPALEIRDAPRFEWRGYMQDVSRTFYGVDIIKKYLDIMALYKMNVLHLHLTDDQGWRIEIKKYPELTSKKTTVFEARHQQPEERSGYYSQEDIKALVKYAAERQISIVPEIDVPGHCWPVIITHPELGVNKTVTPDYVFPFMASWGYWGYQFTPNPLDPTNEKVYTFLDDVFTEIAQLFPSKYIHFGGDEVVHRLWENEPHVKAFMEKNGMKKVEQLQSYFVKRVSEIIVKKGKQPIGWNDILADAENLPASTAIMSWLGRGAVLKAAQNKFYTIATPTGPLYFDIQQHSRDDGTMADLNYQGPNTIEAVYNYDPGKGLSTAESKYLLGVQANMWPAVPQEVKDINVQNFPRLLAVAEIGWTAVDNKELSGFLKRVDAHLPRLDTLKIDYFKPGGYIAGTWQPGQISTDFKMLSWDVTDMVYANGRIMAGFFFTGGASFLKVKNVRLMQDGKLVSEDAHESLADKFRGIPYKKNMFVYHLKMDAYKTGAKYVLMADVAGEKSADSKGNVTLNLSPYQPFTHTQAK